MDIEDLYDVSQDYEDYHYHEDDYDDVLKGRIDKNYVRKGHRKDFCQNVFSCLKGLLIIALVIGGLVLLSFLYKSCMGTLSQVMPDDGEYANQEIIVQTSRDTIHVTSQHFGSAPGFHYRWLTINRIFDRLEACPEDSEEYEDYLIAALSEVQNVLPKIFTMDEEIGSIEQVKRKELSPN